MRPLFAVSDEINRIHCRHGSMPRIKGFLVFKNVFQLVVCKNQILKSGEYLLLVRLNRYDWLSGSPLLMPHTGRVSPINRQSAFIVLQQINMFQIKISVFTLEPFRMWEVFWHSIRCIWNRVSNPIAREQLCKCSLTADKHTPIIIVLAKTAFLMASVFQYHVFIIAGFETFIC